MKQKITLLISVLFTVGFMTQLAHAHCQVPCGIYDDHARVQSMLEDAATVTKAIHEMGELSDKEDVQSMNQTVRWVLNKEKHAESIIQTISNYFLTQRVKPGQDDYLERLGKHHAVMLAAMKTKQSSDSKDAEALVAAIKAIAGYYPEK